MQAQHFSYNPVVLNVSPSFRTWAQRFEYNPIISNASRHFECKPVVSTTSPPFWTKPSQFEREPSISHTTPSFQMRWWTWASSTPGKRDLCRFQQSATSRYELPHPRRHPRAIPTHINGKYFIIVTYYPPSPFTISLSHPPSFLLFLTQYCTKFRKTTSIRFVSLRTTFRHHQHHATAKIDLCPVLESMYYLGSVSLFLGRFYHF